MHAVKFYVHLIYTVFILQMSQVDSVVQVDLDEKVNNSFCFAMEGKSWRVVHQYFPEVLQKLVVRGAIFARMNPDQKQQLVLELQGLGYFVGKSLT